MIQNLAQFKKALSVGALLHCIHHQASAGRDENGKLIYKDEDKGIRPVSIVQTNSFALKTKRTDGTVVDSWCGYPKASETIFKDGVVTILEKDLRQFPGGISTEGNPDYDNLPMIPVLSYSFVG